MTNPKTLARTNDPQTSKDAAKEMVESGALSRQEKMIYDAISEFLKEQALYRYPLDFTTKDIALFMCNNSYHKDYDICRRRFSGLANKGKIEVVGGDRCLSFVKRRDGCRVWRLL